MLAGACVHSLIFPPLSRTPDPGVASDAIFTRLSAVRFHSFAHRGALAFLPLDRHLTALTRYLRVRGAYYILDRVRGPVRVKKQNLVLLKSKTWYCSGIKSETGTTKKRIWYSGYVAYKSRIACVTL